MKWHSITDEGFPQTEGLYLIAAKLLGISNFEEYGYNYEVAYFSKNLDEVEPVGYKEYKDRIGFYRYNDEGDAYEEEANLWMPLPKVRGGYIMKNGWYEVEKDGFPQSETEPYLIAKYAIVPNTWFYEIAFYSKDLSTLVSIFNDLEGEGFYYIDSDGFEIPTKVRYWMPINSPEEESN